MESTKLTFFEKLNNKIKQSVTVRLITIGVLILLLLIPVSMIEDLISERQERQSEAITEVSSKWGAEQIITGLVLTVPYKSFQKVFENDNNQKYRLVESIAYAHFLPEDLNITGTIAPELRYRGIYEVVVYNSRISLSGNFINPDFSEWNIDPNNIFWNDAFVSLGLSDLRGIQENTVLKWGNADYSFNPGVESNDVLENGISTRIKIDTSGNLKNVTTFSLILNINGSNGLSFIPLGKSTKVNIKSTWNTPSFDGAFLPDKRTVNSDGFNANWNVLHLNRPFPQKFCGSQSNIKESTFGVSLLVPVDEYQKSMRSAKYAIMFITLTFLIFFFVQIINGVSIHPIQYIIIGLALCVFYTLLIALSEHIPFSISYLISAIAIISLITAYARSIFKRKSLTMLLCFILILLYLFIYSIIQLEDYALLMGSVGLFIVLSIIMYLSRKINWYSLKARED